MDITTNAQQKKFNLTPASPKDFELAPVTPEAFLPENLGGTPPVQAGIEAPQQEKQGYFQGLGRKFKAGLNTVGEMITEIPQAAEALSDLPTKMLADGMINREVKRGNIDRETAFVLKQNKDTFLPQSNFGQVLPAMPGAETIGDDIADGRINKWFENNAKALSESATRYDKTATEYLKNKQFGKALGAISYGIAESLPATLAALVAPEGALMLGLGTGAQKYDEVKDNEDMSEAMKVADAFTTGMFEWLFEKFGTAEMGKYLGNYVRRTGKEGIQKAFTSGPVMDLISKGYKKFGIWFAPMHEGVSEVLTTMGQNAATKYTGENPDVEIMDNTIESFLVGAGMGGMFSSTAALANKVRGGTPQQPINQSDPDQGVKNIINVYGERLKFNSNVPLAEDQNPLMSIASHKIEDKKYFLTGESGKLGDHVFTGYDYDALKEVGYDFTQVTPRLIKATDIRERMDIPYQEWLQSEVDLYKQTQVQGQQLVTKANAPVQEGQEITLGDKTFNVTFVDENGITLNEIDKNGNLTEGELIVPPEDYEKVFGVPAVDNGQVSPENVTKPGLQPQNIVTEQGQSTSVDNTLIPQLPVNKKGEIEYDQITEPDMYAQGLTQEFGEDAPAILEDLIAEQEAALEKAKKTGNAIEKARKIKAISAELKKLEGAKEILTPTATATQGNLDAQSASPVVEQPEPIEQATAQDVARPEEEDEYAGLTNQERNGVMFAKALPGILNKALEQQKPFRDAFLARVRPGLTYEQYSKLPEEERAELQDLWVNSPEFAEMQAEPDETAPVEAESQEAGEMVESEEESVGSKEEQPTGRQPLSSFKTGDKVRNVTGDVWEVVKIPTNKDQKATLKDADGETVEWNQKIVSWTLEKPTGKSPDVELIKANAEVDTRPTEAQKEAGNYQKGHLKVQGLDISIENPAGSIRKGTDRKGNDWAIMLNNSYGYIRRTVSPEGNDQVDVFLGDNLDSDAVYVIDQINPETGEFDEHKVMLGFRSLQDAKDNYLANYEPGWKGLGDISKMSMDAFKEWVYDEKATKKPLSYKANEQRADQKESPQADTSASEAKKDTDQGSDQAGQGGTEGEAEFAGESIDNAPRTRSLREFNKGDHVKNVKTGNEYEVISIPKTGDVSLKKLGEKQIRNFNAKLAQWVPIQREIKAKGAKRTIKFGPDSQKGKLLARMPQTFKEFVLQFFIGGGRVSHADFLRYVGWKASKAGGYIWAVKGDAEGKKEQGKAFDSFWEDAPEEWGRRGGTEDTNEIADILKDYPSIKEMMAELERLQNKDDNAEVVPDRNMPSPEELGTAVSDADLEDDLSNHEDEVVGRLDDVWDNPDYQIIFDKYSTDKGLDVDKLLTDINNNPEGISNLTPFGLNNKELTTLKNYLEDEQSRRKESQVPENIQGPDKDQGPDRKEDSSGSDQGDRVRGAAEEGQGNEVVIPGSDIGDLKKSVIAYFGDKNIDFTKSPISLREVHLKDGRIFDFINEVEWSQGEYGKEGNPPARYLERNADVNFAKRPDGTLKTKGEYTPEEWSNYTNSVINKKISDLPDPTDEIIERYAGSGLNEKEAIVIDTAYHMETEQNKFPAGYRTADVQKVAPKLLSQGLIHKPTLDNAGVIRLTNKGKELAKKYQKKQEAPKDDIDKLNDLFAERSEKTGEEQSSLSPIQQSQITKINKEYAESIAKKEALIAQAEKDMREALLKADERNGLFGDTIPMEKDEIIDRDEQGFTYTESTIAAVRKPFEERIAELRKQIEELRLEQKGKIESIIRQQDLFAEAPAEPAESKPVDKESLPKLEDFGEKIGGARKDLGITRTARDTDSMPAWRRKYHYANADGTMNLGAPIDTSKPFIVQWSKEIATWNGKRTVYRNVTTIDTRETKVFNSEEEAEAYIPIYEVWKQNFRIRKSGENYVITKASSTGKIVEYGTFPTEEDATTYMYSTEGATSLLNHKREDFSIPALDKVERTGKDWRKGKDVTTEEFMSTFGFRGGEFGNWVKPEERRIMLNAAYDSFMDLAEILNVPPTALSFGGELSIAFGARGIKGAAAHFEPGRAVINLTRMNGAGSLAHEWAHAMDNYFGIQGAKKDYTRDEKGEVKAGNVMRTTSDLLSIQGMRKELSELFDKIVRATQEKSVTRVMGIDEKQKAYDIQRAAAQREADALIKKFENGVRRYKYNRQTKRQEDTIIKATPEQVKKAKAIVDKILDGKGTRPKWDRIPGSKSQFGDYSYISPETLALNELYKEVFGHSGLKRDGNGFYNLGYFADKMYLAKGILDKALAGESETLNVATDFLKVSKEFDKTRANPYWSTKVEMFARAFEYFVQTKLDEKNIRADYLQYDKAPVYDAVYGKNPYPAGEERAELNRLFQEFFDEVKVKTNENEVSLLYENEADYVKDQLDGYDSEAQRQKAVEEAISQTEGRVLDSGLRSTGDILQKVRPRTVLKNFKEAGYVDFIGQKIESPQDIADLWSIHRSPNIEKAHVIFLKDGRIVGSAATTLNRIGSTMFLKPEDVLRLCKKYRADSVYYLHNHPSGSIDPSRVDVLTTNVHNRFLNNHGIAVLGGIILDHNKFSLIDTRTYPVEDGDFYSFQEVDDYINSSVKQFEYKNPQPRLFSDRESLVGAGEERMLEIAKALLTENKYKGAVVYLSSNLEISAYDVFPEGASVKDVIRLSKQGLKNNLGRSVIIIHDGSYGNKFTISGPLPNETIDVINTEINESQYFIKEPRKGYAGVVAKRLWEEQSEYKPEFAGELFEGKQDITQTPAFKKWFGNSKVVDENGKPLVVYHGSEDEKYIFEPFSHFGTEAAARERIKSITDKRGFIHPVYLSAANIIRVSDTGTNSPIDIAHEIGGIDLAIKSFRVYLENIPESELENISLRAGFTDTATVDELVEEAIDRYNRLNKKSGDILDLLGDYREYIIKDAQDKAFLVASSYAKENGIDGIVYENEIEDPGSDSYIVFSPTQIKSATGNKGTFDPENPSILEEPQAPYQFAGDWLANAPVKPPVPPKGPQKPQFAGQYLDQLKTGAPINILQKKSEKRKELWQDRMLSVKKWQEQILSRGGVINDISDPYRQENLSHSVVKNAIDNYNDKILTPFEEVAAKVMKEGKMNYTDLNKYMKAKHAPEYNTAMWRKKEIAKIKADEKIMPEDEIFRIDNINSLTAPDDVNLSGFTTTEANALIEKFEDRLTPDLIDEFWQAKNRATQFTLDRWLADGIINQERYDQIKGMFRYYVPMRGFMPTEIDDLYEYQKRDVGEVVNPLRKAKGRKSEPDDPFQYIVNMAHTAVVVGEKNRIKQHAARLSRFNKDMPDLHRFKKIYRIYDGTTDPDTGLKNYIEVTEKPTQAMYDAGMVMERNDMGHFKGRPQSLAAQHEVDVYISGEKYTMILPADVAEALNKNPSKWDNVAYLMREAKIGQFTRWLSSNFTSKNPGFIILNQMRDVQYATIAHFVKGDTKEAIRFLNNLPKARRAIIQHLKGKGDIKDKYYSMYLDFLRNGGETGYVHLKDVDQLMADIKVDLARLTGTNSTYDKVIHARILRNAGQWLEHMAIRSENMSRFATFIEAKERGLSDKEAAFLAKEITVNFNRKGRISSFMGSLFAFFNASVQGGENVIRMSKQHTGKFLAIGATGMALGFLTALFNNLWGGDDDEGNSEYDQVSDFLKYNNLIIMIPGPKKYITIPLPHGFRWFNSLGVLAYQNVFTDDRTLGNTVKDGLSNLFSAISPVNPVEFLSEEGGLTKRPIVPTFLVPFYDIAENQTFSGARVHKEPFTLAEKEGTAHSALGMDHVNPAIRKLTDWWFRVGKGNSETGSKFYENNRGEWVPVKDAFDVNPSDVEHILEYFLGGRGVFWNDLVKTGGNIIEAGSALATEDKSFGEALEGINSNEFPVLKSLLRQPWRSSIYSRYYDVVDQIERYKYDVNKTNKSLDITEEPVQMRPDMQYKYDLLKALKRDTKNINDELKYVTDPAMIKEMKDTQEMLIRNFLDEVQKLDQK